jgi:hypothetical protein
VSDILFGGLVVWLLVLVPSVASASGSSDKDPMPRQLEKSSSRLLPEDGQISVGEMLEVWGVDSLQEVLDTSPLQRSSQVVKRSEEKGVCDGATKRIWSTGIRGCEQPATRNTKLGISLGKRALWTVQALICTIF